MEKRVLKSIFDFILKLLKSDRFGMEIFTGAVIAGALSGELKSDHFGMEINSIQKI